MGLKVITPPTAEPVSLAEMKNHLRLYQGEQWRDGAEYKECDMVIGTDGNSYVATSDHTAASATKPITGEDYETVWELHTDDEDTLIQNLITAARKYAEHTYCHRTFPVQTLEYSISSFPYEIKLPRPPVIDIVSFKVKVYDGTDLDDLVEDEDFIVDYEAEPAIIVPAPGKVWPCEKLYPLNSIRIRYEAGYTDVPEPIKYWIMLLVAHYYENRQAILPMGHNIMRTPYGIDWLIDGYRVFDWRPDEE